MRELEGWTLIETPSGYRAEKGAARIYVSQDAQGPKLTVWVPEERHSGLGPGVDVPLAVVHRVISSAAERGGIFRCHKHGGYGFVSDCEECAKELA